MSIALIPNISIDTAIAPSFIQIFIESSSLGLERAVQLYNLARACELGWCIEPTLTDDAEYYTFATFKNLLALSSK
jgi:hypothetical protein